MPPTREPVADATPPPELKQTRSCRCHCSCLLDDVNLTPPEFTTDEAPPRLDLGADTTSLWPTTSLRHPC